MTEQQQDAWVTPPPRWESSKVIERLPGVLDRVRPDLLILCHGGNDILRSLDLAAARNNLAAMLDMAAERGIPVVLLGVPEMRLFSNVAPFYDELAEQYAVIYLDDALAKLLRNPRYKSDPIHLNAAGYRALAQAIHERLVEEGAL